MCFGYQSYPKKLITNVKISFPTCDIHKSKLTVAKLHSFKINKTYNCLVFSTSPGSNSLKIYFLQGKTILGHKCILNFLTNYFLQIVKEDGLTIKGSNLPIFVFCYISLFIKGFFATKNLNMELEKTFGLFLEGYISSSLKGQLISSSKFFKILKMI